MVCVCVCVWCLGHVVCKSDVICLASTWKCSSHWVMMEDFQIFQQDLSCYLSSLLTWNFNYRSCKLPGYFEILWIFFYVTRISVDANIQTVTYYILYHLPFLSEVSATGIRQ